MWISFGRRASCLLCKSHVVLQNIYCNAAFRQGKFDKGAFFTPICWNTMQYELPVITQVLIDTMQFNTVECFG